MSTIDVKTYGMETWTKGTRGRHDAAVSSKPRLKDLRLGRDGLLRPRPLWDYNWEQATLANTAGNGEAIFFARTVESGSEIDAAVTANPTTSTILTDLSDGTRLDVDADGIYIASQNPRLDQGMWFTRINRYEALWNHLYIKHGVADWDTTTTPALTVTDITSTIEGFMDPGASYANEAWVCRGSTVHYGRAFYWGYSLEESATASGVGVLTSYRVWYSDLYAYDTITSASQYFDVDGEVGGCISMGGALYIFTTTGRWFVLQGGFADPALGTLSPLGEGPIPRGVADQYKGWDQPRILKNTAYFVTPDNTIGSISAGGQIQEEAFPEIEAVRGLYIDPINEIITVHDASNRPAYYRMQNGVWTEETLVTSGTSFRDDTDIQWTNMDDKEYYFLKENSGNSEWHCWTRDLDVEAPSTDGTGGEDAETYAAINAQLWLPRMRIPGKRFRVREVHVDLLLEGSDGTGARCDLEIEGPTETATFGNITGAYGTEWDANYNDSGRNGKHVRKIFSTLGPFQSWADIKLTNLRHVGIESVTVIYEMSRDRLL